MEKLIIKTEEWSHTCHDGCCHTYGTIIYLNDKKVTSGYANEIDTLLQEVLKYLGYEVQINHNDE